jgi:hypothetical protein
MRPCSQQQQSDLPCYCYYSPCKIIAIGGGAQNVRDNHHDAHDEKRGAIDALLVFVQ